MSVLYLKLMSNFTIRGITTPDGIQVFSIYDFINIVCQKTGSYSRHLWKRLMCNTSKFTEIKEVLVLDIPSSNVMKYTTPGMTVMGLQRLLCILDKKVSEEYHTLVEATFDRYMAGETYMLEEIDLKPTISLFNTKEHGEILSLHYNFMPLI